MFHIVNCSVSSMSASYPIHLRLLLAVATGSATYWLPMKMTGVAIGNAVVIKVRQTVCVVIDTVISTRQWQSFEGGALVEVSSWKYFVR